LNLIGGKRFLADNLDKSIYKLDKSLDNLDKLEEGQNSKEHREEANRGAALIGSHGVGKGATTVLEYIW
jgi:flagellar biosynthesis GTPase FlhF